jgi:hypothetical protein
MKGEMRWRGSNSISVSGHHYTVYRRALSIVHEITGIEGAGGGLDNLLMSIVYGFIK